MLAMSTETARPRHRNTGLRTIAVFEGIKGVAAIGASLGLLGLVHQDIRAIGYALIGHFHLNPQAHFSHLFLNYAAMLADTNLRQLVLLAWAYAALRLIEGYGLWHDRAWAEWLAALSGTLYLPLELKHLYTHVTAINAVVLLSNIAVVIYMALQLKQRRAAKSSPA